jgi:hypothetical protein
VRSTDWCTNDTLAGYLRDAQRSGRSQGHNGPYLQKQYRGLTLAGALLRTTEALARALVGFHGLPAHTLAFLRWVENNVDYDGRRPGPVLTLLPYELLHAVWREAGLPHGPAYGVTVHDGPDDQEPWVMTTSHGTRIIFEEYLPKSIA